MDFILCVRIPDSGTHYSDTSVPILIKLLGVNRVDPGLAQRHFFIPGLLHFYSIEVTGP